MRKKLVEFLSARVRITSQCKPTIPKFSNPNFCTHSKHNTTDIANRPEDQQLLQVLQSEIAYEKSNQQNYGRSKQKQIEKAEKGLLGKFVVDSDPPDSQDVILRRSYDREEIAITALLDSEDAENEDRASDEIYPRNVLFKVCIAKPGVASILLFDCRSVGYGNGSVIERVLFLESPQLLRPSKYRGPAFSRFEDYKLEGVFFDFLEARGINVHLTNFLIIHLHNKEQQQYVQWLHCLESIIKK